MVFGILAPPVALLADVSAPRVTPTAAVVTAPERVEPVARAGRYERPVLPTIAPSSVPHYEPETIQVPRPPRPDPAPSRSGSTVQTVAPAPSSTPTPAPSSTPEPAPTEEPVATEAATTPSETPAAETTAPVVTEEPPPTVVEEIIDDMTDDPEPTP